MSTEPPIDGGKLEAERLVADGKALIASAAAEAEQLELLEPLTPEEMAEARFELGPNAGGLTVVRLAREKRRGRPKGARNKRSDDFARYLLQFGQHPAITMMQLQATPEEVLMERSRRIRQRVVGKGESARVVELTEEMTYEAAAALRVRCAEGLMPYLESKKPVAVDATIRGVMVVEELGDVSRGVTIDGDEPLGILPFGGDEE